jgi:hypothetical protein
MNPAMMGGGMSEQDQMLMEYLMEQGAMQPEVQNIARRREMIDQLRQQSQVPQGVMNAGGRGYQPARSPLEMLAPAIGQGLASYKERGANDASKALQTRKLAGIDRMRSRMGGGRGAQFPQQPMPGEDTQPLL